MKKIAILTLFSVLLLVSCKIYIPYKKEIRESDWPEGLSKGSHNTTELVHLLKIEKTYRYGYDFYLMRSYREGPRKIIEKIDLPVGTEIQVLNFISIESYGVKNWYAIGSVVTKKNKTYTFLTRLHFGYEVPKSVETPWK